MNKALLVALREYMENLKTKAFWIGIMAFPVILVLSIGIPILLEKKKDVRLYAVLDRSGGLLEAVEARAALPDMKKVLGEALDRYERGGKDFEELPDPLRGIAPVLAAQVEKKTGEGASGAAEGGKESPGEKERREKIRNDVLEAVAARIAAASSVEGFREMTGGLIPEEARKEAEEAFFSGFIEPIRKWWRKLPPGESKKFASGLAKSRYKRIDVDLSGPDPEGKLKKMLSEKKIFAYFVIGPDPVAGNEGCKYVSNNLTDTDLETWFSRLASAEVRSRRIRDAKIDPMVARKIQEPLRFDMKKISEKGEETEVEKTDEVRQWAPVAFVYLLWISIFMIAQMLMTNTIEEKSNKIMEVLLSSVSPIQLMAGKIVGIAGTGLTMVVSWVVFFFACLKLVPVLFGKGPDIDFSLIARDPIFITSFLAYFIMGYLLLSAILVGIGSVCNSLKEAQNLMAPVTIMLIVPLVAMVPISRDPNGTIAKFLSYIPPFTPFVMMNRAAGPPSALEYVATTILLLVSIVFALWASAKVFRIGILMTGKPPRLKEILRWIRAPVGQIHARREE